MINRAKLERAGEDNTFVKLLYGKDRAVIPQTIEEQQRLGANHPEEVSPGLQRTAGCCNAAACLTCIKSDMHLLLCFLLPAAKWKAFLPVWKLSYRG